MKKKLPRNFGKMSYEDITKDFGYKLESTKQVCHLKDWKNNFQEVDKKQWRKERPLATGVLAYFPDALLEVAHTSFKGNEQHNAGQPLHWAREKSTDQLDAALRHITDHLKGEPIDDDGCFHLSKAIWRICAQLQIILENKK